MDEKLKNIKQQLQELVDEYEINDISVYIEKTTSQCVGEEEKVIKRNITISIEV